MSKLAIFNGPKVRTKYFPPQTNISEEEEKAVMRVMKSKVLSGYRGSYQKEFFGYVECQAVEKEFSEKFGTTYAISCNSASTGLLIALGACGIGNGDEVIVSPYSMDVSATSPLWWNSVPVFSDLDNYYCISNDSIKKKINRSTKVILPVSLFGDIYDFRTINHLAKMSNLYTVADESQAIGSYFQYPDGTKKWCGSLADLNVFSGTFGKTIFAGEFGIILTNNSDLARRCQLIKNHACAVLSSMESDEVRNRFADNMDNNMLGSNFRCTEMVAAVMREQLKKLDKIVEVKRERVKYLHEGLKQIPAITPSPVREGTYHSYYVDSYLWDSDKADGLQRDVFVNAVKAELTPSIDRIDRGVCLGNGYIQPLYRNPLFRRRKLYGGTDFPFNLATTDLNKNYSPEEHPVVEKYWKDTLFLSLYHLLDLQKEDMDDIINAFCKVWDNRKELSQRKVL